MGEYIDKLEVWMQAEKAAGRFGDLKMGSKLYTQDEIDARTPEQAEAMMEATAKAVYETITGKRNSVDITHKEF